MTEAMTTAGTFWFYAGLSIILWGLLIKLMPEVGIRTLTVGMITDEILFRTRHLEKPWKRSMNISSKFRKIVYTLVL